MLHLQVLGSQGLSVCLLDDVQAVLLCGHQQVLLNVLVLQGLLQPGAEHGEGGNVQRLVSRVELGTAEHGEGLLRDNSIKLRDWLRIVGAPEPGLSSWARWAQQGDVEKPRRGEQRTVEQPAAHLLQHSLRVGQ
uniref:Uncharacterized protein n=1 Tax=Ixodes ricinus TaxID=34613 RepID=A0A6B0URQ6_IXORI